MIEMEERDKEKIGKQLVKDTEIEQILKYFDVGDILFQINDLDIVERIDEHILRMVDDEELSEGISYSKIKNHHSLFATVVLLYLSKRLATIYV